MLRVSCNLSLHTLICAGVTIEDEKFIGRATKIPGHPR